MDASVLNPMIFSQLISFASCALNHNLLFFEIPWSRHLCSQVFILGLVSACFSIPSSVLCSSSPFFVVGLPPTAFVHPFYWSLPRTSMASLFSCRLSQPNHSYYLKYTSSCCSTALPFFHFPICLHQVFLLEYLAFSVVKHNFSKSHLDSPFGTSFSFSLFQIFTASKFLPDIKVTFIMLFS